MLTALSVAVLALATVTPPGPVTIDLVSATGTGCQSGTTAVSISPDKQAFTVTYSDFTVQGHGQTAHKDCTLTVQVNPPAGFTYGIDETDFRGFAHLDAGARGVVTSTYHFTGLPTRHATQTFAGPVDDDWQFTDMPDAGSVVHGPCKEHKPLTITADLKLDGQSAASFMTMDSTDGEVSLRYHLSWLQC
ncbi:DUF4360 domain-containing protein [Kutzneria buriramensis]|uniref:Uncharacterized protein DUF4360 n=1 Tax=Kutzneria buriramensis TaxID=1045776 RepID=A0A3E0GU82_9PSEU|nr:DUF4360 domain-containing protein [Kutzneria buriramensis]REH28444.1 uncharacterized protein DUF4360 [Kutzneria buriramensis]